MGQIIIDLPLRVRRRYKIADAKLAAELLASLQTSARRVTKNPDYLTAEDLSDIRAARAAREKGEFVSWEEAKIILDKLD